ncbi:hypothetical protein ABPG77_001552 [Micractinium sp. CCAP 211/92]
MSGQQSKRSRVVLLTGACTNLGSSVALAYARQGARLVLVGWKEEKDKLEKLARLCASIGGPGADMHARDLADPEQLDTIAHAMLSRQGRVDVLCFIPDQSVAGLDGSSVTKGDPEAWERGMAAGVLAPIRLVSRLVPSMAENGRGNILAAVWDPEEPCMAGGAGEAATKSGLEGWMQSCGEARWLGGLAKQGISVSLVRVRGEREEHLREAAEAFLLPFRLSPACSPPAVVMGAAAARHQRLDSPSSAELLPEKGQQQTAEMGEVQGASGGVAAATGARLVAGLMIRDADPGEPGMAKSDTPGTVLTPSNPALLEPEVAHFYDHEPARDPRLLVQCKQPFNGETPHAILADSFTTPADLHFIRNHLPLPRGLSAKDHSITIDGEGLGSIRLSLQELKSSFNKTSFHSVVQCAGNRRSEMAAHRLVEGRAPWNAGAIGNAIWGGVLLCDVLARLWPQDSNKPDALREKFKHVIFIGADKHGQTGTNYEGSIPLEKALDPKGDVLLCWEMNGEELLPDHGYPLRVIIPGHVGARQVKWLSRIFLSEKESQASTWAPWQQKDYRLLPQSVTDHEGAEGELGWASMPSVQSAVLTPEAGTVYPAGTTSSIRAKGYAWSGGGQPIARVDVSADGGATWSVARIVEQESRPSGRMWAWTMWEADVPVPEQKRREGGPFKILCKAMDAACNTQPEHVATIWNFRGLNCNTWGTVPLRLE